MVDNNPRAVERHRVESEKHSHSEDDSDDAQFITIKVTANPTCSIADEEFERTDYSDMEEIRPSPLPHKVHHRVTLVESPSKFEDHPELHEHHEHYGHHPKMVESPFHEAGKVFFLLFIWILMVLFLTSTPEKKIEKRQLVVPIDEPKFYNLPRQPNGTLISLTIQAPFLPNQKEFTRFRKSSNKSNRILDPKNKDNSLTIFLRTDSDRVLTPNKTFYLFKPEEIDSVNATNIEFTFDITEDNLEDLHDDDVIQVVFVSNFSKSSTEEKQEMPITISVDFTPINKQIGMLFATFTLMLLYVCIIWEVSCVLEL